MAKTVLVADDHAFTAAGMVEALRSTPDIDVVAVAANGLEAIAAVKRLKPDCAVVDLSMPGANGLEVMIEGRRWSPATCFAIVTANANAATFSNLLDAGVQGLFLKTRPSAEICEGIRRVAHGQRVVSEAVESVLERARRNETLSAREIEVLQAVARGLPNSGISERLGVSVKTVESHRANLMRKLAVHSTASLLVKAMRDGLIDVSDEA